jgi:hypothetical protein
VILEEVSKCLEIFASDESHIDLAISWNPLRMKNYPFHPIKENNIKRGNLVYSSLFYGIK